jgi:hypothetical protein
VASTRSRSCFLAADLADGGSFDWHLLLGQVMMMRLFGTGTSRRSPGFGCGQLRECFAHTGRLQYAQLCSAHAPQTRQTMLLLRFCLFVPMSPSLFRLTPDDGCSIC